MSYFNQALAIIREIGNQTVESATLNNIGLVYKNQGQYDQALSYYNQALVIIREIGDRVGEGTTLNNIGAVYQSQGQYDQALSYYNQALVIKSDSTPRIQETHILAGHIICQLVDYLLFQQGIPDE